MTSPHRGNRKTWWHLSNTWNSIDYFSFCSPRNKSMSGNVSPLLTVTFLSGLAACFQVQMCFQNLRIKVIGLSSLGAHLTSESSSCLPPLFQASLGRTVAWMAALSVSSWTLGKSCSIRATSQGSYSGPWNWQGAGICSAPYRFSMHWHVLQAFCSVLWGTQSWKMWIGNTSYITFLFVCRSLREGYTASWRLKEGLQPAGWIIKSNDSPGQGMQGTLL